MHMYKLHNILYCDKIKEDKQRKTGEEKITKKCRIAAKIRQEKGLHMEKMRQICFGNDTGQSDYLYET